MNLIVKLTNGDGSEIEDSTSLMAISGVLVVQGISNPMETANMIVTKIVTGQQVYNGTAQNGTIPTGAGSVKVVITQFGSSIEKDIQVAGETSLNLSNDIVTVTPQSGIVSWSINGVNIPSLSTISVLKGITKTVRHVFGQWKNGTDIYTSQSYTFSRNTTIHFDYSAPLFIVTSGNFIVPMTKTYQVVMTGGGGGGGGGACENTTSGTAGHGGRGGDGGEVRAVEMNYTADQVISVTIGTGGNGGSGGVVQSTYSGTAGTAGSDGGTTIFGSYSANGGAGGTAGSAIHSSRAYAGYGGQGGDGSNSTNMFIFDSTVSFGQGGDGGIHSWSAGTTTTPGKDGGVPNTDIDWLTNVGAGGKGGTSGYNSNYTWTGGQGGLGGYGFNTYGRGGTGGRGGQQGTRNSVTPTNGNAGSKGNNGAIAIRMVI